MPNRHRRVWTKNEDHELQFYWGERSLTWLAEHFQRTEWGVSQHARALGLGPASRGTDSVSMRELERRSGFSVPKILQAAEALKLRLWRIETSDPAHRSPKRAYAINEDQVERLIEYMLANPLIYSNAPNAQRTTKGLWGVGKKPLVCASCGRNDRPHCAKDKCKICYNAGFKKRGMMPPDFARDDAHLQQILDEMERRR